MFAHRSLFPAIAVLLLTSPALSQSVSIPIPNYDFASPYVADAPPYAVAGFTNWVQSAPPAWWTADGYTTGQWIDTAGVFVNVPYEWIDNLVPSGGTTVHQQAAFMFSTPGLQLSQTLSSTFQVGTSYQLTVAIQGGGYGMPIGTPMEIGLYYLNAAGNQVMVGTTTVLNELALSGTSYITHLPDWSLTIPAVTATNPWASQNIGVALIQPNTGATTGYWDIDNVRLVATTTLAPTAVWTGAGGNTNWSNSGNWTSGVPNSASATAVITAPAASPITVTLDSPQTVGTLTLGSANGTTVTISGTGGNTLTMDNSGSGATIVALGGSAHDIDAPVVLAENLSVSGSGTLAFGVSSSLTDGGSNYSLTMSGTGGTLILSGSDNYSGGTTVLSGTLIVTSQTALPEGSSLTLGAGGTFVFDPSQVFAATIEGLSDAPSGQVVSAVPEPGTLALLGVAVAGAVGVARDRLKMFFVSAAHLPAARFTSILAAAPPRGPNVGDVLLDLACERHFSGSNSDYAGTKADHPGLASEPVLHLEAHPACENIVVGKYSGVCCRQRIAGLNR